MSQFFGVIRHEYGMCVRRPGMWIAYGCLFVFTFISMVDPNPTTPVSSLTEKQLWHTAGQAMFLGNMFMTLLGGILAADRMQRDFRLGVRELQRSTPLSLPAYILSKYLGVLAGVLTPMLLWSLAIAALGVAQGAPLAFVGMMLVAFVAIGVPAYAFVVAFSLACPLVMPVRVYQVLFTGYWFWGNYLNPDAFPTISRTLLVPSGEYVLGAFFVDVTGKSGGAAMLHTPTDAVLNLLILGACIVAVLVCLYGYLRWQAQRA